MHMTSAIRTASPVTALQLALRLEFLEAGFYGRALTNPAFSTGAQAFTPIERAVITQISKHENAHVSLLRASLGASAPPQPATHDFTGGSGTGNGPFPGVFTTKAEFLKVAQLLEDFGVRAYMGQGSELMSDKNLLTTALRIQAVEGRHAARIRTLRGESAWISGTSSTGYTTFVAASGKSQADLAIGVYGPVGQPGVQGLSAGEDNLVQGTVIFAALATSEAFDEPVSAETVNAVAALFAA